MMRRALRENGAAAVSIVVVVMAMLSPKTKLMGVSLAWVALYLLQRVLVGKRRCSDHWFVKYGTMAAYYLPTTLVFYAANICLVHHHPPPVHSVLTGVLFMLLYTYVFTQAGEFFTNMRAYSLRDRPRGGYNFLMWLVLLVFLVWAPIPSPNWSGLDRLAYTGESFFMALFILFPNTSESTLDCQTKAVADYMKQLKSSKSSTGSPSTSTSTSPFFDDDDANSSVQLDYCRYPFVERKDGEWVTIKDLVQRDDLPNEDKDIWLSYSLCRLLARRYYGFHCAEEGDDKVRRFALAGLGTEDGYKRAFTIVEVQLSFLHDYIFTGSLPIIESGFGYINFVAQYVTSSLIAIMFTFFDAFPIRNKLVSMIHMIVMAAIMCLSWCQLYGTPTSLLVQNLLASYWRPIHTAFRKINGLPKAGSRRTARGLIRDLVFPNPNAQEVLIDPFQTQTDGANWRNKIGQYSIIQDYDRGRSPKKALEDWFNKTMLSQPYYKFIKHLPVEEEEVDILKLDNMRELVANTLWGIDGQPTNGTRSLKLNKDEINRARKNRNGAQYDWLWTCRQETHTGTILIWHIATCYCDMTPKSDDILVKWHHEAARAMSRYCAYLVAFLPEFLPEHILTTKQVFQRVLQEAQQELGKKPMEEEEKRTKIRGLQLPDQHEQRTTFQKGVELGRQLEMIDDDKVRWKVIAEFWAETILYVAPSDNAEAHIEQLAKGGEFITHLWAMLSNAGILKRATGEWHQPPASTTIEGPPTHQLMEALSSSNEASTSSMSSPPIQTSEPPTNEKGKQLLESHEQ